MLAIHGRSAFQIDTVANLLPNCQDASGPRFRENNEMPKFERVTGDARDYQPSTGILVETRTPHFT